jgi:quercetin dioxygenase-like cupin family protein
MNLLDLLENHKTLSVKPLFEGEGKINAIYIKAANGLKEHKSSIPALLLCVEGSVQYSTEKGEVIQLTAGDYVNIEPHVLHALHATEDAMLVLAK